MSTTFVVQPREFHPVYDASWITWTDPRTSAVYAVPTHAPRRIVASASMKPGAKCVTTRPAGSEIWHPHLSI